MKSDPRDGKEMKTSSSEARSFLAGGLAGIAAWAAGCGSGPSYVSEEEKYRIDEPPGQEHIIGYDQTGFPVYGIDEEGQPIIKRPKK